ncbi:MAG: hypothetical protein D6759_01110 [Chloroflexi bacterium]|nr:MAG: hypothetical protein D6759_01110 [Chloroflexota bacterium]
MLYPTITRLLPLTTIRRERTLPIPGEVRVRLGAPVEPVQIIARAQKPGDFYLVNVARLLKVPPKVADRAIRVQEGQDVRAGQRIAVYRPALGLIPRACRSPVDGTVVATGGGRLLIQATTSETVEVRAYLKGSVVQVIPERGAVIETTGAWVQGTWGSGGHAYGVLKMLVERPDQPVRAKMIDITCHGAVIMGGLIQDEATLQQAIELQVRAIIVGSLPADLIELARQAPFPIVATEGLGQVPMALPIFQLLRQNEGREAIVSGEMQQRWEVIRPEIIIPLPTGTKPPLPEVPETVLRVGHQVRVTRGPYRGAVGRIASLSSAPQPMEAGFRLPGAWVRLEALAEEAVKEPVFVPYLNLEWMG